MVTKRKRRSLHIGTVINYVLLALVAFACVYPFWYTLMYSFSTNVDPSKIRLLFWPMGFGTEAYRIVFSNDYILKSYGNTIFITVVGTIISVIMTSMAGYCISRKHMFGRGFFSLFIFFTMLFNGGMIPTFFVVRSLGLYNSIWALILPSLVAPYNLFLMRNFFLSIPQEIEESARIDGANDLMIFFRIIVPLSLAVIATITLFYAVSYWNAWFNALIYLKDKTYYPLQMVMREILMTNDMSKFAGAGGAGTGMWGLQKSAAESVRMAVIVVAIGPIIIVYPFLQRYFIKGVIIGAVKG